MTSDEAISFAFEVLTLFVAKDSERLMSLGQVPPEHFSLCFDEIDRYPETIVAPLQEVKAHTLGGIDIFGEHWVDIPFSSVRRAVTDLELRISIKKVDGAPKFTFCDVLVP